FQAEDGIRDRNVTGVQTCALPIYIFYYPPHPKSDIAGYHVPVDKAGEELVGKTPAMIRKVGVSLAFVPEDRLGMGLVGGMGMVRSEERRVGEEGRAGGGRGGGWET